MSSIFHKGYWIVLVAVIVLSAGYAYHRDLPGLFSYFQTSEEEVQALNNELDAARMEEEDLKDRVEGAAGQDPVELETTARSKDLVREGVTIYKIEFVDTGADGSDS